MISLFSLKHIDVLRGEWEFGTEQLWLSLRGVDTAKPRGRPEGRNKKGPEKSEPLEFMLTGVRTEFKTRGFSVLCSTDWATTRLWWITLFVAAPRTEMGWSKRGLSVTCSKKAPVPAPGDSLNVRCSKNSYWRFNRPDSVRNRPNYYILPIQKHYTGSSKSVWNDHRRISVYDPFRPFNPNFRMATISC